MIMELQSVADNLTEALDRVNAHDRAVSSDSLRLTDVRALLLESLATLAVLVTVPE